MIRTALALSLVALVVGCASPQPSPPPASPTVAVTSHDDVLEPGEIMEEPVLETISR